MIKQVFFYSSMISILLMTGLILVVTYWYVYPYKVLSFQKGNGTFIEKTVKSGEYLQMNQNACKYLDIPSTINRQFVDGLVYQSPIFSANRPVKCVHEIEYIYVPKSLPLGKYHIRTVIMFKVNPIRTVSYTVTTEDFTIVK